MISRSISSAGVHAPLLQPAKPVTELGLWFSSKPQLELIKTTFRTPVVKEEVIAIRGKTAGAFGTNVTFQWTSAVQAISILLLRAAGHGLRNFKSLLPLLQGEKNTLAASLDAAIYKGVAWLDLFGANSSGESLSRRILTRSNPGRRRAGPVMLALNEHVLPNKAIAVYIDELRVEDSKVIERYANVIETAWNAAHPTTAPQAAARRNSSLRL